MKIFHTGDWHLGKIVNQMAMIEDQDHALGQLIQLMEEEKPDALIIAGDLYDRAIPPVEAVELLDRVLNRILLELEIPVLLISGNHDSPDRVGFGSRLLQAKGLHIAGPFGKEVTRVTLADEHGPIHFYLLPYVSPGVVREVLGGGEDIQDHNSAMKAILNQLRQTWLPGERRVLITHGFVRGVEELEQSESEKNLSYSLSVGGTDYIDVDHFQDFTYVALGHLHRPQRAGSDRVHYAGSLLKYSFSEANHQKGISVVQIASDGQVEVEKRPLATRRDVRKIRGNIADLLDPAVHKDTNVQDYLHVTLTDEGELLEPMAKLRTVYPNVMALALEKRADAGKGEITSAGAGYQEKTKLNLFKDFYEDLTGRTFSPEKQNILKKVIREVEEEERRA